MGLLDLFGKSRDNADINLEQKIITTFIFAIVATGGIAFIGINTGIIGSAEQFGCKDEIPFNSNYWQLLDENRNEVANGESNSKSDAEFCANEKANEITQKTLRNRNFTANYQHKR